MHELAGAEGIEPSIVVLETTVIPLNYAPLLLRNSLRIVFCLDQKSMEPIYMTIQAPDMFFRFYDEYE